MKFNLSKKEKKFWSKFKEISWVFPFIFVVFILGVLLIELIIPMVISVMTGLIALVSSWGDLTNENFIFIGAIFFFIVGWKILVWTVLIFEGLLGMTIRYYQKNMEKHPRRKQ